MQCDETIWNCVGKDFCSFRTKFQDVNLCRNIYNVTGQCTRASCPLANSYYGTILEEQGTCYLYLKTIERAHTPRKLWEKVRLSSNKDKALEQIETRMKNVFKEHQTKKCIQRYLRIKEYLARMRRISLKPQVTLQSESRKLVRREKNREIKALKAAEIQKSVQEELIARLKRGHYGDIYNFSRTDFAELTKLGENEDAESISSEEENEYIERGEEELESADSELAADESNDMENLELVLN